MSQFKIKELIGKAELALERGFPILPGHVIVKSREMASILDRMDGSIPEDIKDAELILRRRDEIQAEAQNRADRMITDAQNEASRIVSESELYRTIQQEAAKIREQVMQDCEEMKKNAMLEADEIKSRAIEEAMQIKTGAQNYAEQVLNNLDVDLNQLQSIVKNGQEQLARLKSESSSQMNSKDSIYPASVYDEEYVVE